ncbi:YqgE/AlgH family protein [Acidimangrovimonas sediminis]|uniref:YqgE/AlgH family protein n=1 Tax=Acidimangrovimonas sediminis TaxID=2056283 RepID=UPI001E4C3385|nr:YqgE/AlgH family protein [Acidimangrovimonas sediminis]
MTDAPPPMNLTGTLLIAMPGMGDPRFEHSVIFVCEHSDRGAMGLIVNKPVPDLPFARLLEQLEIEVGPGARGIRVHFGGPVENGRGFVLHSPDYNSALGTQEVGDEFAMTATLDVLEDISAGRGPARALLALGYAGWGPGQIEEEILQNGWITADASAEIVFSGDNATKWERALKTLGIDAITLSSTAGRA